MYAAGTAALPRAGRWNPRQIGDFTHGPVVKAIGGFGLFWLGIAHPTDHPGSPAPRELSGVSVSVGAVIHLLRTRRTCTSPNQKPTSHSGKDFTSHVISM